MSSRRSWMVLVVITSIFLIILFGSWFIKEIQKSDKFLNSKEVLSKYNNQNQVRNQNQARIGSSFRLLDQDGNTRTEEDFRGKNMIVYFGYSFCPDICPTTLYLITQVLEKLGKKSRDLKPVFITVDPDRDTISRLKSYINDYHPLFLALTGTKNQVTSVKEAYRVYSLRISNGELQENYLVDHSSIIYLIDKQGLFLNHFSHSSSVEEILYYLTKLAKNR